MINKKVKKGLSVFLEFTDLNYFDEWKKKNNVEFKQVILLELYI